PPPPAPDLWGLFIEDLNDALDGGLNAELRNGDFEFGEADHEGWDALAAWRVEAAVEVHQDDLVHENNAHHVGVAGPSVLVHEGWDGIALAAGERLRLSCFARAHGEPVRLEASADGLARDGANLVPGGWQHVEVDLVADGGGRGLLRLEVDAGVVDLDCVSLRPLGADGEPLTFRPDLLGP
ncbi:MAG TPA: hypothetical protein VHG10_00485, partial [Glycomyces sp.]|nr:hypothetical protein [Glycomyces sp.]